MLPPLPETRKTRIVCISDTHCQTPKLPKGDVLIHAGDLTNQGSYSELKKTVEWLEKAPFEAKIVVAGNHDITLDAQGYNEHGHLRRWPEPQDPEACRRLLTGSRSITYLENEAAIIYLNAETGPRTCFSVYGSPCSPTTRQWGFGYEHGDASTLWNAIPEADIVITHTPPKGVCDAALTVNEQVGCGVLLEALHRIRPMLAVCGHIHEARGVEFVRWNDSPREGGSLVEQKELWKDPDEGSKRQALVNITAKNGRHVDNCSRLTRHRRILAMSDSDGGQNEAFRVLQPCGHDSTSGTGNAPPSEAAFRALEGGAWEFRQGSTTSDASEGDAKATRRRESVVVNASVMGPRLGRKQSGVCNKPIVIDVDLPMWHLESDAG